MGAEPRLAFHASIARYGGLSRRLVASSSFLAYFAEGKLKRRSQIICELSG